MEGGIEKCIDLQSWIILELHGLANVIELQIMQFYLFIFDVGL
jgi:hypothetical protein